MLNSVEDVYTRLEKIDKSLKAFVAEPNRLERLQKSFDQLSSKLDSNTFLPLSGQIFGVKDIFHVDGLPTKAGSCLPPSALEGPQADCVTKLQRAGAILLGKTATTEFAYFEPAETRNPRNHEFTPGGSSSGSAAAVGAGMCDFTLGTQTVGSVIRPAAFCGVVGFKPSFSRIETSGLIYFSPSIDTVGIFSTSVQIIAEVCAVLCKDWSKTISVLPPTIGVPIGEYLNQCGEEGRHFFSDHVDCLKSAGFNVKHVEVFGDIKAINENHRALIASEAAQVHSELFVNYGTLYKHKTAQLILEGQEIDESVVATINDHRSECYARLEDVMDVNGIDIWISPAALGSAPKGLMTTGDPSMNLPWSYMGMPALNIPAGKGFEGLPIGLQCTSRLSFDEELLSWGIQMSEAIKKIYMN